MPIPAVLLWSQNPLPSPTVFMSPPKEIVNPAHNLPAPPSLAVSEQNEVSNIKMLEIVRASMPALPLPLSAATPVQIDGPEQGNQNPQTTSLDSKEPTVAHVISVPDSPVRAQDLLVIPPANQVAVGDDSGAGSGGEAAVHSAAQGAGSGTVPERPEAAGLTQITLPKDGKFSVVVQGSSASELYPDIEGLSIGKVVYTVYVRVGFRKNWILQYWLPKGSELGSASIDAPWPFLILRPDQLSSIDFDYVILHGAINENGRFEKLALVYPNELPEQQKLLAALRQWSFRPARREGQAIAIEALLVIPRQGE